MTPASALVAGSRQGVRCASCGPDGRWQTATTLPDQDVRCLAADPHRPGLLFAGTQGNGLWRSADGGRSWQRAGLAGQIVKSVVVSAAEAGTLYAGTKPALLFVSHDGGDTWAELEGLRQAPGREQWWTPSETPAIAYVKGLAASPTRPGLLLAGIEVGGVLRSADGGRTWEAHRSGALLDCHQLCFHPTAGDWAYEGGNNGGAISQDGGQSFRQLPGLDRTYGWAVAADPENPALWYVSASTGPWAAHGGVNAQACVYRADGDAWHRLSGGLPQPLASMPYELVAATGGQLYLGLANGDVWHSPDRGETWEQLPCNLGAVNYGLIVL